MNIFIFLSIFVAATANKNESVDDASVALQLNLHRKRFVGLAFLYQMPRNIFLEGKPLPQQTDSYGTSEVKQYYSDDCDKNGDTNKDGTNCKSKRIGLLRARRVAFIKAFEGKYWSLFTLNAVAPISPLFLMSNFMPQSDWSEAGSEATKEKLGFVNHLVCSWFGAGHMSLDTSVEPPKNTKATNMAKQWFPVLPESEGGKNHDGHPCGWSFADEAEANTAAPDIDTYWKGDVYTKTFRGNTHFKLPGEGDCPAKVDESNIPSACMPGIIKTFDSEVTNQHWSSASFKLAEDGTSGLSTGNVYKVGNSEPETRKSTIAFHQIQLSDYPNFFKPDTMDDEYVGRYKAIVADWSQQFMNRLLEDGTNKELDDRPKVNGFLHLLANRILAILVRNPRGDNAKDTDPQAWIGVDGTPVTATDDFLKRFGRIRFRHFHSPVVDLADLRHTLLSLGLRDYGEIDLAKIKTSVDQGEPTDLARIVRSFDHQNVLDVQNPPSIGIFIYRMVESVYKAANPDGGRFFNEGWWPALSTFCLMRDRSDHAFMLYKNWYSSGQEAQEMNDGTVDKGGCNGLGLLNYLQYVFHLDPEARKETFRVTKTQQRDTEFEKWFHAFNIRPGPLGSGHSKGLWFNNRLWYGLEEWFKPEEGDPFSMVVMEPSNH